MMLSAVMTGWNLLGEMLALSLPFAPGSSSGQALSLSKGSRGLLNLPDQLPIMVSFDKLRTGSAHHERKLI